MKSEASVGPGCWSVPGMERGVASKAPGTGCGWYLPGTRLGLKSVVSTYMSRSAWSHPGVGLRLQSEASIGPG
jgi:hypothetical protein